MEFHRDHRRSRDFYLEWDPNHKSHAMTSSEIFKNGTFCGAKISQNGRSEAVAHWHLTRILVKGEGENYR